MTSAMKRFFAVAVLLCVLAVLPAHSMHAQTAAQPVSASSAQQDSAKATESNDSASKSKESESKEEQEARADKAEHDAMRHSSTVKMMGHWFGLSPETAAMVFDWLSFAILAGAIMWFLLKKLPPLFRTRTSTIEKQLVEARAATQDANARLAAVEDRLRRLDGEIDGIRKQAEKDAAAEEKRIKASVEEEKQKILAATEQEIAAATTNAQRQIRKYAAELAIEQAAQRLQISEDTDRELVRGFAASLSGDGGAN